MAGRSPLSRLGLPVEAEYSLALISLFICFLTALIKNEGIPSLGISSSRAINHTIYRLIIFFFLWSLLTVSFASVDPGEKYLDLWLVLFSFLLPVWLIKTDKDLRLLLVILTLACSLLAIMGLYVIETQEIGRLSVLGGGPNVFARMMFIGSSSALSLAYWNKDKGYQRYIPYVVSSLACLIAFILSGSRGAVVAAVVAFIVFIIMLLINYGTKLNQGLRRIAISLCVLSFLTLPVFFDRIYSVYINRFMYLFTDAPGGTAIKGRSQLMQTAFDMFENSPLLGHGIGSFKLSTGDYPHNFSLELLAEMGIIGFLPLFVVTITVFFLLLVFPRLSRLPHVSNTVMNKHPNRAAESGLIFLINSFMFFVVAVHFSGDMFDSRWLFFLWGLAIALFRLAETVNSPRRPRVR